MIKEQLLQFYLISSISAGLLVMAGIFSLYLASRSRLILNYLLFQLTFILHTLFYLLYYYIEAGIIKSGEGTKGSIILAISCDLISITFFLLIPYLIKGLTDRGQKRGPGVGFIIIFLINLALIIPVNSFLKESLPLNLARKILFSISLLYVVTHSALRLWQIRGQIIKPLKLYSLIVGALTLIFSPLILLYDFLTLKSQLFSPLLFLIVNILAVIYFVRRSLSFAANFGPQEAGADFYEKNGITAREKEIIEELFKGASYKEMSDKLFISLNTVKKHVNNIYRKTGVKNKMELLRKATREQNR